ncbi:hypothetical protein M514_21734 [Trichuris suis]|uniref:Uncharacterized protein n=1 Tax=Trichuris suis TaxID=68888 RepID=A0A085N9B2_9BILA|nr:hypothetical protein M514_21734 [Trichuris suis]
MEDQYESQWGGFHALNYISGKQSKCLFENKHRRLKQRKCKTTKTTKGNTANDYSMAAFCPRLCNDTMDYSEVSDEMTVGLSEPSSCEDEGKGHEADDCWVTSIADEVDGWESFTATRILSQSA